MKKLPTTELAITGPRSLRDPRSREYAIQTMQSLKRFLESKTFDAKHIKEELQEIEQHKHWEVCGHKNLDDYLQAEIGMTQKRLERRLAEDLAADPDVQPAAGHGGARTKQVADRHLSTLSSESAERIVRRLKRDHPEIADALARGEFKSARAAAIAASIIKKLSLVDRIRKLLKQATKPERRTIYLDLEQEFGKRRS